MVLYAGDYKGYKVMAEDTEITGMVMGAELFQDVFSPFWSGTIHIVDTQNMVQNIPIAQGTKITIRIETDGPLPESGQKNFEFYVHKIAERRQIKQETYMYVVDLITKSYFNDIIKRVSKSFINKKPEDIISTIVKDYLEGELEQIDPSDNNASLIIPNWSPWQAVAYCTKFATSQQAADYLFFQSENNKYRFLSLEKMLTQHDSGIELKVVNPNKRDNPAEELTDSFINMEEMEFRTQFNTPGNFSMGYFGSTLYTHDIIKKKVQKTVFKYGQDIAEDLAKKPFLSQLFNNPELANISFFPQHKGIIEDNLKVPGDLQFDWLQSRKSNFLKLDQNRLLFNMPGFATVGDHLGEMITLKIPSHQDLIPESIYDEYMNNKWVVVAIRHSITHTKYHLTIEVNKKRLDKPLQETIA